MARSRCSLAILAMTLGHSDGFTLDSVTDHPAQAVAFGMEEDPHRADELATKSRHSMKIYWTPG
jgi:hypothetical protein